MCVPAEKPSLDLSGLKPITVKAGQTIKVEVPIKGYPPPTATWEKGTDAVTKDDRTKIEASVPVISGTRIYFCDVTSIFKSG